MAKYSYKDEEFVHHYLTNDEETSSEQIEEDINWVDEYDGEIDFGTIIENYGIYPEDYDSLADFIDTVNEAKEESDYGEDFDEDYDEDYDEY